MLCYSVILTAFSCILSGIMMNEGLPGVYRNVTDKAVTISELPVNHIKSKTVFDVKKVSIACSKKLDSSLIETLGPELIPGFWKSYRYYFFGRIQLNESVNSYIIYASSTEDERDRILFLVNTVNDCLTSISTLSHDYYYSWAHYGHTYSTIERTRIGLYESFVYINDEIEEGESIRTPLFYRICVLLKQLFKTRNKEYSHVIDIELDNQGYLHELVPQFD